MLCNETGKLSERGRLRLCMWNGFGDIERELLYLINWPYGKIRPYSFLIVRPSCQEFGFPVFYYSAFQIRPNGPVRY